MGLCVTSLHQRPCTGHQGSGSQSFGLGPSAVSVEVPPPATATCILNTHDGQDLVPEEQNTANGVCKTATQGDQRLSTLQLSRCVHSSWLELPSGSSNSHCTDSTLHFTSVRPFQISTTHEARRLANPNPAKLDIYYPRSASLRICTILSAFWSGIGLANGHLDK